MQNLSENEHTLREEEANLVPKAFPLKLVGATHFLREKPWGQGWEEATWSGWSGHFKEWWDTFCTSLKCPSCVCAYPSTVGLNGWPLMNRKGHMHTVHYQNMPEIGTT